MWPCAYVANPLGVTLAGGLHLSVHDHGLLLKPQRASRSNKAGLKQMTGHLAQAQVMIMLRLLQQA